MTLSAGYAQNDITPGLDKPVYLAGFGRDRRATAIHDALYVRALALKSENTAIVLAAVDLIGFFRWHVLDVREAFQKSCPDFDLILASTHTHHGPDTMGLYGPGAFTSGVDPDYMASLKQIITRTLVAAASHISDVRMKACSVKVTGLAKNARNPDIRDEELTCLQFISGDAILATLMNFPCHPEVLFDENTVITSDYPGFLRAAVEGDTRAPCLFFSGALGGMMTPDVEEHSFAEAEHMGKTLAAAGLAALEESPIVDPPSLSHQRKVFTTPLFSPLLRLAMITGVIQGGPTWKAKKTTEANLLRIGPAWLAGVPGELLPKLGLEIKTMMREAGADVVGVIGLANDETGYILPEEDYRYPPNPFSPGDHYEETNAIGPKIGSRLMAAMKSMIQAEKN
jgi:hypothetical protein